MSRQKGFQESEKALGHLKKCHSVLATAIKKFGPIELEKHSESTPYGALIRSVAFQQLAGAAARTIYGRVLQIFPKQQLPKPSIFLKVDDLKLRSAGLSGSKVKTMKSIAQAAVDGIVPNEKEIHKLSDAEISERLITIHGVGQWTADMLLMFWLRRPDVWPVTDYGVRKGYAKMFNLKELPAPKVLATKGDLFKPYRSSAAWYFWRILDKD